MCVPPPSSWMRISWPTSSLLDVSSNSESLPAGAPTAISRSSGPPAVTAKCVVVVTALPIGAHSNCLVSCDSTPGPRTSMTLTPPDTFGSISSMIKQASSRAPPVVWLVTFSMTQTRPVVSQSSQPSTARNCAAPWPICEMRRVQVTELSTTVSRYSLPLISSGLVPGHAPATSQNFARVAPHVRAIKRTPSIARRP